MNRAWRVTPLRAWVIALILVLPMLAPLLMPSMLPQPVESLYLSDDYYRQELIEYLQTPRAERKRPIGVMLTMSGGSCATVGPLRLAPEGVEMYVIYYPGATLSDFHWVTDTMVQGKLDFIVIQDTVLSFSRSLVYQLYLRSRQYWRKLLYSIIGLQDSKVGELTRCGVKTMPLKAWSGSVSRSIARIDPYSVRRREYVELFLSRFTDKKIPIMIASPPHNRFTAHYRSLVFDLASELVARGSALSGVSQHRQSEPTPTAQFRDPNHLSPKWSGAYRSWLSTEIERTLRVDND